MSDRRQDRFVFVGFRFGYFETQAYTAAATLASFSYDLVRALINGFWLVSISFNTSQATLSSRPNVERFVVKRVNNLVGRHFGRRRVVFVGSRVERC